MFTFPVSGVETYWWLPGLVAVIISFFTSMGGLSGAFILMPFQVSILGFSSPAVSPTNLVYNIVAIPGGVYRFVREKRMIWPLVFIITAGTIPGLIFGAYLRVKFLTNPENFKLFVGLVLLYIVIKLAKDIISNSKKIQGNGKFNVNLLHFNLKEIKFDFKGISYRISNVLVFLLVLVVGVIGGAYGIGGGAIIAPFLVAVFGLPVYSITGTALLSTFVSSVFGVAIYSYLLPMFAPDLPAIKPDWLLGFSLGIGGFIGIYLGARFQRYFPPKFIKVVLLVSISIVVIKYVGGYFFS